jgi:prepilin-type N-terminal cleavage/methylation domain-containing protein
LGFTLLEVLVVIGLIAVLTGLVIGAGRHASETGRSSRACAELVVMAAALESYKATHGDYPRTDVPARLLQSLIGKRGPNYQPLAMRPLLDIARFTTSGGLDPFVSDSAAVLDPWGQSYRYAYKSQAPWSNPSYALYSAGPDGEDAAILHSGGFPDRTAAGNVDNIYAH